MEIPGGSRVSRDGILLTLESLAHVRQWYNRSISAPLFHYTSKKDRVKKDVVHWVSNTALNQHPTLPRPEPKPSQVSGHQRDIDQQYNLRSRGTEKTSQQHFFAYKFRDIAA